MLLSGLVSLLKLFCMSQNSETTWEIYLHTCFCKIVSNKNPTVILAYPSLLYKYSKAVSWFCVDNVLFPPVTFTFFPQQSASLQSQQIILNIFFSQMLAKHYVSSFHFLFEWIQWQRSSHYCQQEGFLGGGQWGLASPLGVTALPDLDVSVPNFFNLVICITEFDIHVF